MKPTIGRVVLYRSRTGNYTVPAIITATTDSLYQPNVDAGHIAGLTDEQHVHLSALTPGKPGTRGSENVDMLVPDSDARPIRPNIAGLYQEDDVPQWDPAWLPESPVFDHEHLDLQPAGTWTWPPRV